MIFTFCYPIDGCAFRTVPRPDQVVLWHHDVQRKRHALGRGFAAIGQGAAILRVRPGERVGRAVLAERERHVRDRRNHLARDDTRRQPGHLRNALGREQ